MRGNALKVRVFRKHRSSTRRFQQLTVTPPSHALEAGLDDTIADAASRMVTHAVHSLPVVDESTHLMGIVTTTDIMQALLHGIGLKTAVEQHDANPMPTELVMRRAIEAANSATLHKTDPDGFAASMLDQLIEPMRLVSNYGLFAVMTTQREEIVIEGSQDGVEWREYEFRCKPDDVARRPLWNIPHQPRLDWQMWFAALDDPRNVRWFPRFLERLLENEPAVTALLERNPFADQPPQYIRARFYDYTFASGEERSQGLWWRRREVGLYFPVVHLKVK